jgi:hypothetical protein
MFTLSIYVFFDTVKKFRRAKPLCYTSSMMRLHWTDSRERRHRTGRQIPKWQRLILVGYAALLTFVLPFICWGAWAEPGHPHGSPHFVFATPVIAGSPNAGNSLSQIVWSLQSYCGNPRMDEPAAIAGTDGTTDLGSVAGQSLPDTTLVVSMLLILFVGWLQLESLRQTTERVKQFCVATPFAPLVPTPPPRFG